MTGTADVSSMFGFWVWLYKNHPAVFVAVAVFFCIVAWIALQGVEMMKAWWQRKTVIIVGSGRAGKTALFHKLLGNTYSRYVPTLAPQRALYKPGKIYMPPVKLVDLPGDAKLIHHTSEWIRKADGIIFVIDGAYYLQTIDDTITKLYKVVEDEIQVRKRVPVLLLVNKTDMGDKVHTLKVVKSVLESKLCVPASHVCESGGGYRDYLRDEGVVYMAATSVEQGSSHTVQEFIQKVCDDAINITRQ